MIENLTPEQPALLPVYRDKWLRIGLSTERCDRSKAEDAARRAYIVAGLEPPSQFVWFESPLSLAIGASIGASVRDSVRDSVWASVRDSVWDSVYGSQDAHWLGFFAYFREVCNLRSCDRLVPLMDLAENCGWWIPRQNVCFMSEKPIICELQDGVIHSDQGPAIAYADGFKVWAIEGVRVDEQIVMLPETQSIEQIEAEQNEEIKRIRLNRFGWDKYLAAVEAEVLDISVHNWMESLMSTKSGLKVLCTYDPSTGRPYHLEVHPSCTTCEEAQRYLLSPNQALGRLGLNTLKLKTYPLVRS